MSRRLWPVILVLPMLGVLLGLAPVADPIFKDGFAGRDVQFTAGPANVKYAEKDHKISAEHGKSGLSSEYIKIDAPGPGGAAEAEYVHYDYATPPAPVTERLTASVFVKAFRPGIQIKVRVVFPKEKDPRTPDAALTTLITGDSYDKVRQWQQLGFGNLKDLVNKHLPVLHARLGRAVDPTDAYVDRIVLNVYAGPGVSEVWIDDLEIGPVKEGAQPPPRREATQGGPVGRTTKKALPVEFTDGQILVDGEPFFMLAIRHSNTPLKTLRDAQFNTVWFPSDATPETIEDAIRHGFWVVPTLPLPAGEWDGKKPKIADQAALDRDADTVSRYLRKFLAGDAILMWNLGSGRTAEDLPRVARAADLVRTYDPRRPRAVDLWDGYSTYGSYVNAIGAHRWPLFSSLELTRYKDWLAQRKALTSPGKLTWTWIQTHLPDWYVTQLTGKAEADGFPDPVGPHPEQIRILTYLALAAGHRGLGFWSDKYLENPFHGRDRLLELALLNDEIEMLKPVLFGSSDPAKWVPTGNPNILAAVIRGDKELLVLPVWLGPGTQYTPAQMSLPSLTVTVPLVPDGAIPWMVSPAGVTEIKNVQRVSGGTLIQIPEFDTTAAIVFTSDLGPTGKVVRWQDHVRTAGKLAARNAQQQAIEQYNKTLAVHTKIVQCGGPEIVEAADLFRDAKWHIQAAKDYADNNQHDAAFLEARRALRPLRVLMRADWQKATDTLDPPTASPFAVSFYSLPQHWALAQQVRTSRPAGNGFPHGGFELRDRAPTTGAAVSSLPGWEVRTLILDRAEGRAVIINTDGKGIADERPKDVPGLPSRYGPERVRPQPIEFRQPEAGRHCLMLELSTKADPIPTGKDKKDPPKAVGVPQALERAIVSVESPPAEFVPGSLVRISFWVKVAGIGSSADGLVAFDSAGGEPLAVRVLATVGWKQYRLYRRIPADGKIAMTFALTGFGQALIDDVRIEPMIPAAAVLPAGDR